MSCAIALERAKQDGVTHRYGKALFPLFHYERGQVDGAASGGA